MSKALRVPDYLGHILQAIERIGAYTAGLDEVKFLNSPMVQDAVIRNIEIIGTAANHIQSVAPEFTADHAGVPWQVMYAMRNRLSHAYHKVDLEIIWATVQRDLPELYAAVKALPQA